MQVIKNIALNAGLIGAAGYCGLMIWHGGISGSSLIKITEPGHLASLTSDSIKPLVPELIDFNSTVFSTMNLAITGVLLITLPLVMYFIGGRVKTKVPKLKTDSKSEKVEKHLIGAEKIDHSSVIGRIIGVYFLLLHLSSNRSS